MLVMLWYYLLVKCDCLWSYILVKKTVHACDCVHCIQSEKINCHEMHSNVNPRVLVKHVPLTATRVQSEAIVISVHM